MQAVKKNLLKMESLDAKNFVIYNSNCDRNQLESLLAQRNLEAAE